MVEETLKERYVYDKDPHKKSEFQYIHALHWICIWLKGSFLIMWVMPFGILVDIVPDVGKYF